MTVYADIDHSTGDLSQYDSTVGTVTYRSFAGWQNSGCIHALGALAADAYGRIDLGAERSVLYVRAFVNLPLAHDPVFLRGRDGTDAATTFSLSPIWTGKDMTIRFIAYKDAGSTTHDLTPPTDCHGICFVEIRLETGAGGGWMQAWINGEEVLAATRVGPNSTKTTRYVDVGAIGCPGGPATPYYIDEIACADEYIGLGDFDFVPSTAKAPWTQSLPGDKTDTHAVFKIDAYATGGWQSLLPNLAGKYHVIEKLILTPGCTGMVEFRDKNESVLWTSPQKWATERGAPTEFSGRNHGLEFAKEIRIHQPRRPCVIYAHVRYAS